MAFRKKRLLPLLVLILCTAMAVSVPMTVLAAEATLSFTNFEFAGSFSSMTYDVSHTSGKGTASITDNVLSISATGVGSGCSAENSKTNVKFTAKETVSITYTLSDASCTPPGTVSDNGDGTHTVIVSKGASIYFYVEAGNESTTSNGKVTFNLVKTAESKVPADAASYSNGGKFYSYLDEAIAAAQSGSDKVIAVAQDGKVYHSSVETEEEYTKSFTIPSGITLLIPFDSANTRYESKPEAVTGFTLPTAYRTLTLESGTTISVDGAISVSGKHSASMNSYNGQPTGPQGFLVMQEGSNITVNNGGKIYAWGYVVGEKRSSNTEIPKGGTITIKNGGNVYECFQVTDYRGGTVTNSMVDNPYKVFPLSQYYVQNVQIPMTLEAGATETGYMSVDVTGAGIQSAPVPFIGSSGLFRISSGSIIKDYNEQNDRLIIDVNGSLTVASMTINIKVGMFANVKLVSGNYVLPLTSNMTVNLNSGSTVTLDQDMALIPGSAMNIKKGATLNVGTASAARNLYIYDSDDWGGYCTEYDLTFAPLNYAYDRFSKRAESSLTDAQMLVNGTLDSTNGVVYTTAGGGAISSTGTGTFISGSKGTQENTYQLKQNSSKIEAWVEVPITPAQLLNGDKTSYLKTADNAVVPNTFTYTEGKWVCTTHTDADKNHICDVCGQKASECIDEPAAEGEFADHICDICGKEDMTECADGEDEDTLCDTCGANCCAHDVEVTPAVEVPATCVADGHKAYWTCGTCGKSFSDEACTTEIPDVETWKTGEGLIEAKGHSYGEGVQTTAPTCQEDGVMTYTCTIEGCTEEMEGHTKTESIPAKGHTYGEAAYSWAADYSSCTVTLTCSVCEEGIEGHALSATDSQPEASTVPGNCQTNAETTYTASVELNGTTYSKTETVTGEKDTAVHVNIVDVAGTPATCTESGLSDGKKCESCGIFTEPQTAISALGHDWATTLTQGETQHWYDCNRCDATKDTMAHTYTWTTDKEASCYQAGSKSGECSCGATATEEISATGQHTYSETYTTENGNHWKACTTTGCTAKSEEKACSDVTTDTDHNCDICGAANVTAHAYTQEVADETYKVSDATCTAKATYLKSCDCGKEGTETFESGEVAPDNHVNTETHAQTDATCTEIGYTAGTYCNDCETWISGHAEIEALDHAYTGEIKSDGNGKDATHSFKCINGCNEYGGTVAHTWNAGAVTTEPDCEIAGLKTFTCTAEGCGATYTEEVAALEHTDADNDGDHICDRDGCTETVTTCGDVGKDHICDTDSACAVYSNGSNAHADSDDDNHTCDYCDQTVEGEDCADTNNDHKCDECGKDGITDHDYGAVTYTGDGKSSYTATRSCACGDTQTAEAVITSTITKEASCTAEGETTYTAEFTEDWAIDKTTTENIAELDHSFTTKASSSVKTEATCNAVAVYWAQCDSCTAVSNTVTVNGTEFDPVNHAGGTEGVAAVPATCQSTGTSAGTKCLGCNSVISGCTETEKLECADTNNDHICDNGCQKKLTDCDFTARGDAVTEANCVTKAVYKAKCSVCGVVSDTITIEGEVDSSKHTGKNHTESAKDATCTDMGYSGDIICECGAMVQQGTTIQATGHGEKETAYTQITGEAKHTVTTTCMTCGEVVSTTTGTCVDAGSGSCECGRVMQAEVNVENKTNKDGIWSISGNTMNVKHTLACVVLVEETGGTYRHISAMANVTADGYDFDVSEVESGETVVIALKGDINCDGELDMMDQLCMDYLTANKSHPSYMTLDDVIGYFAVDLNAEGLMLVADLCRDGELDMMDQLYIDYATANASLYIALEWDIADN